MNLLKSLKKIWQRKGSPFKKSEEIPIEPVDEKQKAVIIKMKTPTQEFLEKNPPNE